MDSEEGVLVDESKPGSFNKNDVAEKSPCGQYVRYKKIIGRGAFKDVYKGFDLVRNTEIAWNQICIDDETTLNSPDNQEKLFSEAVLLKSLSHKNIMKCYSFWLDYEKKTVNMISELFASGSLRQYIKKLGAVDVPTIKNWGRQILQGLQYLQTLNPRIIHRDLKCDNIFVDANNGHEMKIGDFGLAIPIEQGPLRVLVGTPEFMAPEYYDEEYDELVDVYAFGLCLMELATCDYPYSECTNPAQIFKKVSSGIKPAALGKVKDPEVKEIIEKCLLPSPSRPSATELLKDRFFSSSEVSGEIDEGNSTDSCLTVADMDESRAGSCSSLEVALGGRSMDMHEHVLSGLSALYNFMSLSDGDHGELRRCCGYESSWGDFSVNSRVTFASSSGAVSRDLSVSESKSFLFGKSQGT